MWDKVRKRIVDACDVMDMVMAAVVVIGIVIAVIGIFPQIGELWCHREETVAVVVHKISELVLCKDRIFTNITPQVFTLTPKMVAFFRPQKNATKMYYISLIFICLRRCVLFHKN